MNKKNNTVATAKDSKTTNKNNNTNNIQQNNIVVTKVPTGKFISLAEKKKRREEREKQYETLRINCLKRRAKRMNLTEDQINEKIEELLKIIREPNTYSILIMFNKNDTDLIKQTLLNNKIKYKILSEGYGWIEGDQNVLNKVRELVVPGTKIYPYVKKKSAVLPKKHESKKKPMTKAEKKKLATEAKKARKKINIQAHFDHKLHATQQKEMRKEKLLRTLKNYEKFKNVPKKLSKKKRSKIIKMANKKTSNELKNAA